MSSSLDEFACPLPLIRKRWDETGNEVSWETHLCGEPLFVTYYETKYLYRQGECEGCGALWKVECANGHVLLVPDHEADDDFDLVPFELQRASEALNGIAYLGPHTREVIV